MSVEAETEENEEVKRPRNPPTHENGAELVLVLVLGSFPVRKEITLEEGIMDNQSDRNCAGGGHSGRAGDGGVDMHHLGL